MSIRESTLIASILPLVQALNFIARGENAWHMSCGSALPAAAAISCMAIRPLLLSESEPPAWGEKAA